MTLEYSVRIERLADQDGGGYLAVIPDLPGCMSDGATPEQALANVQDAITSWIESAREWQQEVPPPSRRTTRLGQLGGSQPDLKDVPRRRSQA